MKYMSKLAYIQILVIIVLFIKIDARAARIDKVSISSQFTEDSILVCIISPEQVRTEDKVPTIYLLNGYGGDESTWLKIVPNLSSLVDKYNIRVVAPDGRDSWYWDSPKQKSSLYESFFVHELYPYIAENYSVLGGREHTAIMGFSMGGHGAFWLAMHHPNLFGAIGSISGGLDLRNFKVNWNLRDHLGVYASNSELWAAYTVTPLVDKLSESTYKIKFDCGESDFFFPVNQEFHKLLTKKGIEHEFSSRSGSHTNVYARESFESYLRFFSTYFLESTH